MTATTAWTSDELTKIGAAHELEFAVRPTLPISGAILKQTLRRQWSCCRAPGTGENHSRDRSGAGDQRADGNMHGKPGVNTAPLRTRGRPRRDPSVMTSLSLEDVRTLLDAPSATVLTTNRMDGTALTSPVWFRRTGLAFEVVIGRDGVKLLHLERDPHCVLVIFETVAPFRGVEVRGTATLTR